MVDADRLEHCMKLIAGYISVLRGEQQDLTGRGMYNIMESALEDAMDVKIISKDRWESTLIELEKPNYKMITEEEHKGICAIQGRNWSSDYHMQFQKWKDAGRTGSYTVTVWCHDCKTQYKYERSY